MSSQMSPKVQNQIQQLQQVQQQLQTVLSQKAQYEIEIRETRRADEELADLPADATVFQSVGTVMMQKPKEAVSAALKEKVETLELRIKQLERQEQMLQGRFETLQNQVKQALEGGPQLGGGAGPSAT
ncbi:MAG TPA: prefoldin subunit beta [Methanoregulaceae archaeon]|nr:prefoldin subunit beta [Methanoregulaceae archaeon]